MKSLTSSLLTTVAFAALAGCAHRDPHPTPAPETQSELIRLENEINDAYLRRNTATLEQVFAPEYVYVNAEGVMTRRAEEIQKLATGALRLDTLTMPECEVTSYGGFALATLRTSMSGSYRGAAFAGQERLTDVWVRRMGRWQLVRTHASPIR